MDVVILFASFELALILLYALPLPHGIFHSFNTLRPNFWLLLGSVVTSAVPFYDGISTLTKYKPRAGEAVAYETDPRYLQASIVTFRSLIVFLLLISFLIVQYVSTKLSETKIALEKLHLNRLATQKQAEAASKHSLQMMNEMDAMSKGAQPSVDRLTEENKKLKDHLQETKKLMEDLEAKVKYNDTEHASLIEEMSKLQKKLNISGNSNKKND
mmetsp:Transcript_13355/g.16623  ORF Transcript_13355/g.16623 Transcript_13355/m.16623 type:complete len:214 (+) Transcript_13355:256-897(+)|eukprot:CAMPEP_0204826884 /NCGR_PEP_ID=MMETSP1346-20131115/4492_1 /ASSEMBLY_ACC=CAM_ASM_000771 /TAXON_ID=215587 /ORGANISM="Aplanochytrium stocchinoi, Strain GSBS06" /LENGTH=213 /DNA_ID=CAMNT_0051955113 /DNA_START=250 /DNA_END=891 /DNA_ORIENTATION=-